VCANYALNLKVLGPNARLAMYILCNVGTTDIGALHEHAYCSRLRPLSFRSSKVDYGTRKTEKTATINDLLALWFLSYILLFVFVY
jgi:hypothetical protein